MVKYGIIRADIYFFHMSSIPLKISLPEELLLQIKYLAEEDCTTVPRKIVELARDSLRNEEDRVFGSLMQERLKQADPKKSLTLDQLKNDFQL